MTSTNRAVFGISHTGRGWYVWKATSFDYGDWTFSYSNKYVTTREKAIAEAQRLARDPAYENWHVSFDFRR